MAQTEASKKMKTELQGKKPQKCMNIAFIASVKLKLY